MKFNLGDRLREIARSLSDWNLSDLTMRIPAEPDRDADLVVMRAADELDRLTECLKAANASTEKFEREWYLRGDEIDRLTAESDALRALLQVLFDLKCNFGVARSLRADEALKAQRPEPDCEIGYQKGLEDGKKLAALKQRPECKCDLRTKLVGDGCEVCNPELAQREEKPE